LKRSPMKRKTPLLMAGDARTSVPVFKPRKCDARKGGCGETFKPTRQMQVMCGGACALSHVAWLNAKKAEKAAKDDRKATRVRLEELRPLKWFHAKTKLAVHAYIRLRDAALPCISCGTTQAAQWDAGHFKSVGANSSLRYDLANIHKQCSVCNQHKSGNLILYRQNLIPKIGEHEVLRLEGPQQIRKWTREELARIEAEAKAAARELEKQTTP
jgi:hypothetical protein